MTGTEPTSASGRVLGLDGPRSLFAADVALCFAFVCCIVVLCWRWRSSRRLMSSVVVVVLSCVTMIVLIGVDLFIPMHLATLFTDF